MSHIVAGIEIEPKKDLRSFGREGRVEETTVEEINSRLGFTSNGWMDEKVEYAWKFTANGFDCAIWSYRSSHLWNQFSFFGPAEIFTKIFGDRAKSELLDDNRLHRTMLDHMVGAIISEL
jgi:hypothetical protein